jgi:hypothetical protein
MAKKSTNITPRFAAGQLTIIDLSDPFIDPASACGLFEIMTRLFVRINAGTTGKVLVTDEAHKVCGYGVLFFCAIDFGISPVPFRQRWQLRADEVSP